MLAYEITTALLESQGTVCTKDNVIRIVQMGADPMHIFN
jgi:hypothetical protein